MSGRRAARLAWILTAAAAFAPACSNSPYADADSGRRILYTTFAEAPRTLDPAVAYTTAAHAVTGNVYDTLLEYHYLLRPYTLIPGLGETVPEAEPRPDGRVAYRFTLRPDLLYDDDPCFALGGAGRTTRRIVADDVAFQLMRLGDPAVNSPVIDKFTAVHGFAAFSAALAERRAADPAFAALPAHEQYRAAGGVAGIRTRGERGLEIVLDEPYPQILYWFAMQFTSPVPWEAIAYYDGEDGRPHFQDHPVASGPYRLARYDKHAAMILEVNPNWYGVRHPEWKAPGATYPSEGMPGDAEAGLLDEARVGTPLPRIERIEFLREKESIPAFNKFLQGYYDASGIIRESFDKVIREDALSPEMSALGMELEKSVIPGVYYLGFNMDDDVVGAPAGERGRKLRQAMSLVIPTEEYLRLFLNKRGVPAQSLVPPGIFGYEEGYRNPYRQVDLGRARTLLAEAGYPGGADPATGEPLLLHFDTPDTSAAGLLRFRFFVQEWRKLGIDVEIQATNYNQFQEKIRQGAYQIFQWGWIADYPDPENFLFLLTSEMARSHNGGPNTANFSDARYDRLFAAMRARENDAERMRLIREMRALVERERPWIELFYPEDYTLFHGWLLDVKPAGMSFPTTKYIDLDAERRARLRAAWNEPVVWPLLALAGAAIVVVIPGIVTYLRERQ